MPILITNGLGNPGNGGSANLVSTAGYGAPGLLACAAFLAIGLQALEAQLIVTFNFTFNASGPAIRPDGYYITLVGAGDPVEVLDVQVDGASSTVTLLTTRHTYNGTYTLHMPEVGLLSTDGRPFNGPFELNYLGGVGTPVNIQLTRSLDARRIDVIFDRRVNQQDAENVANYAISPNLKVVSSRKISDLNYRLTTEQQVLDQLYTVTATNIRGA